MGSKIQVGYKGTPKHKPASYGKRRRGKYVENGGFSGQPTVSFTSVDQDSWDKMFPDSYKPSWMKID
jgi:hypothetical protein